MAPPEFAGPGRLLHQLYRLREDARGASGRWRGGPETLLHGDLWPKNVFVSTADDAPRARLSTGSRRRRPFSYDLSTFLYRSVGEERPWLLERYRAAAERAGRRLPGTQS